MVEETRELLRIMGIEAERLRLKWISAAEGALFAAEMQAFVERLRELEENPLHTRRTWNAKPGLGGVQKTAKTPFRLSGEQIEYCMECSTCTGTCPVSREHPTFAPKQIIKQAVMNLEEEMLRSRELWSCLGCAHCSMRCPALIDFPEFNRSYRIAARRIGQEPSESHHGILQHIARLQTRPIRQQRTFWAQESGRFHARGEYFYFVGCLPYFETTFRYLNLTPLASARSVLTLLNSIGIEPVISQDERCCGHDAFWSGDENTFRELALWNIETIRSSGAKTVIFSCPEGYMVCKNEYPKYFGELPFKVIHMAELLVRELPKAGVIFKKSPGSVLTYQDPCRLGRWAGIYEAPRQLLSFIPGAKLVEMERNREDALCCGTSAWIECSRCSKAIQTERLLEAEQTGAKTLITACPKCQIHLNCALGGENIDIGVQDIYSYLADRIEQE